MNATSAIVGDDVIVVNRIRTRLLTAGTPEADEAVVFVHGNPGSAEDWRGLVAATGTFTRAVAWDHPGYGRADKPAGFDYTVGGYAAHLDRVLDALGVRRVHLVVHDFGGAWGLAWAAQHPARFASAALLNTGVLRGYRWHRLARIWRTPLLGEAFMRTSNRPAFRLLLRHGNPRGLPPELVARMYQDLRDRGMQRAVLRLYRATDIGTDSEALHQRLRPLDRPTLVVWGRHDPYLPLRYAEAQRETFRRAEVVVLNDSGHWPFADNPERVQQRVTEFLRRQIGASPAGANEIEEERDDDDHRHTRSPAP